MSIWKLFFAFRTFVLIIILGIQFFLYRKISAHGAARNSRTVKNLIRACFIAMNLPLVITLLWRPQLQSIPPWLILTGVYPYYVWHFSSILLFFIIIGSTLLKKSARIFARLLARPQANDAGPKDRHEATAFQRYDSGRRLFLSQGATILAGATITGTAYGAFTRDNYELSQAHIPISNLPPNFEGFTIALISDIHSSVFMTGEQMQRYADIVNSIGADLIVIPGDFVNSMVEEVYPFTEAFSRLKAPCGIYGVLGNHDFYTQKIDIVAREVEKCGIRLLRNRNAVISNGKERISIIGIDDTNSQDRAREYLKEALESVEKGIPRILLSHKPYFFKHAQENGVDFMVSGHTHGGQIVFLSIGGTVIAPARVYSPYVAGLYTRGNSRLYVSRGIGTVGVPLRINCPPEITKITLIRQRV